jgi:drug/metabolite transporter (DMT)-like permease
MTVTAVAVRQQEATRVGIPIALASAASFGISGPLAKSLLDAGWSPVAVVAARLGGAFAVLAIPTLIVLLRTSWPTWRQARRLVVYGIVAMALAQVCYVNAVQYLSVGVAILLEFQAPVLLIIWHWWRTKTPPTKPVLIGAAVAMLGLIGVLDVLSGLKLHPVGVLWGLCAALCLTAYFILSDDTHSETTSSPLLMTTVGTGVGALVLLAVGSVGLLPLTAATAPVELAGNSLPWWLPVLLYILVAAVFAYLSGIIAVRRLGSSVASFVALTEVIFAVIAAMLLVGQRPSPGQIVGGALVLTGIAIIQRFNRRRAAAEPYETVGELQ